MFRFVKRLHLRKINGSIPVLKSQKWRKSRKPIKLYPLVLALPLPMLQSNATEGGKEETHEYPTPLPPTDINVGEQPGAYVSVSNAIPWKYAVFATIAIGSLLSGAILYSKYTPNNLSDEQKQLLQLIVNQRNTAEILVLGKSGVGKSYLIDALIESSIAHSDKDVIHNSSNTATEQIESYHVDITIQDYTVAKLKIWDSVGFYGDFTEQECVQQLHIAQNCGTILLVLDGSSPRLNDDLERLYPILNGLYHDKSWIKKAIIVMTRGNQVIDLNSKEYLQQRMEQWKQVISSKLIKIGLTKKEANSIPIRWSFEKNDNQWKETLVATIIERVQKDQINALEMLEIVQDSRDVLRRIRKRSWIIAPDYY
eukprot:20081_1